MKCEHVHDSAAYVLGALSPPERDAYERHLDGCAACRAEVADLAVLPGLLGRLDASTAQAVGSGALSPAWGSPMTQQSADVASPTAGPDTHDPLLPRMLDRAMARRRAERRRRRWQMAAAALFAACLGAFAVIGVRAVGADAPVVPATPATPDFVAMREVAAPVPITATLALEARTRGTTVRMRCAYKPAASTSTGASASASAGAGAGASTGAGTGTGKWTYRLVAVPKVGEPEELNSWTAGYGDVYEMTGYIKILRQDIRRIEIRKGDGSPLLVLEVS